MTLEPIDPPESPYVKIPQQKRSREKFLAIVNQAKRLFSEKGVQQTTIQEIAEAAGVSVGIVYQRFDSKESLLLYLFEEVKQEISQFTLTNTNSPHETLEAAIHLVCNTYAQNRAYFKALLVESHQFTPLLKQVASALDLGIKLLSQSLERNGLKAKQAKRIATFTLRQVMAMNDQLLIFGDLTPGKDCRTTNALIAELKISVLAYADSVQGGNEKKA